MSRTALALSLALACPLAAAAAPVALASLEDFARAVAMKPGGWHTRFEVTSIEVDGPPGMDADGVEAFKAAMPIKAGSVEERDECAGPGGEGPSLPGILLDKGCTFSRMEAGDGRWAVNSSCVHRGQGSLTTIASQGTYSAEAVTGRHEVDLAMGGAVVHVKGDMTARFTGQCRPPAPPVSVTVERPH